MNTSHTDSTEIQERREQVEQLIEHAVATAFPLLASAEVLQMVRSAMWKHGCSVDTSARAAAAAQGLSPQANLKRGETKALGRSLGRSHTVRALFEEVLRQARTGKTLFQKKVLHDFYLDQLLPKNGNDTFKPCMDSLVADGLLEKRRGGYALTWDENTILQEIAPPVIRMLARKSPDGATRTELQAFILDGPVIPGPAVEHVLSSIENHDDISVDAGIYTLRTGAVVDFANGPLTRKTKRDFIAEVLDIAAVPDHRQDTAMFRVSFVTAGKCRNAQEEAIAAVRAVAEKYEPKDEGERCEVVFMIATSATAV